MGRIRGKRLTLEQRAKVIEAGIPSKETNDWLLQKVIYEQNGSNKNLSKLSRDTEMYLQIVHRVTAEVRKVRMQMDV